jgi:tRNA pseudouridine55 synthase
MNKELDGIFIIDKPADISSAQALSRVKKKTGVRKAGHTGTLDPFATGVLVCCLNKATRLAHFLMAGPKIYDAELVLGIATDTQDCVGKVVSSGNYSHITEMDIRQAFETYIGMIEQYPPVFSALKSNGVPLYRLARSGNPVQKPARKKMIYANEILTIDLPCITFRVTCSSGTYIRSLCADIGADLGCGGHLKQLRRIESGGFSLDDAVAWEELDRVDGENALRKKIVGMSDALKHMPACVADEALAEKIRHGQHLSGNDLAAERFPSVVAEFYGDYIKIVDGRDSLLAIVQRPLDGDRFDYCCVFSAC